MRPLHLRIEAFGSYPGVEEIDFAALGELGLFLVTGPTGSGKTTIFDAMVFALYGTVPGSRRAEEVHSQHARPGSVPRVVLQFEAGGDRWRVERTARYERPVRRGEGTTVEQPNAALSAWRDGAWQPLLAGVREVNAAVTASVGLDAAQFQRVVLLPQGQFEQFLIARSDDRKVLLRQLFGSEVYERVVDELRRQAGAARQDLDELQREVEREGDALRRHLADAERLTDAAPFDELPAEQRLSRLRVALTDADEHRRITGSIAARARDQLAEARQVAQRWAARESRVDELRRLEAEAPVVDARRAELSAATRARAVRDLVPTERAAARRRADAHSAVAAAVQRATRLHAQLEPSSTGLDDGALADPAVRRSIRQRMAALQRDADAVVHLARQAAAAAAEHDRAMAQATRASATVEQARSQAEAAESALLARRDDHASLQVPADDLAAAEVAADEATRQLATRVELDDLEQRCIQSTRRAARADAVYHESFAAFVGDAAPRLAEALADGEPCPVCGAIEHPSPAATAQGTTVTLAQLDRLRDAAAMARSERDELAGRIAVQRARLGAAADAPLDGLRHAAETAAARLVDLRERAVRAAEVAEVIAVAEQHVVERRRALAEASERAAAATAVADAAGAAAASASDALRQAPLSPDEAHRQVECAQLLAEALDAIDEAGSALERADEAASGATRAVEAAVADGGWPDAEVALAAALPDDVMGRLARQIEQWDRALAAVQAQLAADDEVVGDEPPDVVSLDAFAAATDAEHTAATARATGLQVHIELAEQQLGRLEPAEAALARAAARAQITADAFERCAGQLAPKVSLESWVLGTELDRVVDAANEHLAEMTAGRYRLARVTDTTDARVATGLDLVVDDAFTGLARRTTSLSGGERFQASLALALGLADVVTSGVTATARTLDALYVDEGFGSLDATALEQAISTLDRLRVHGRQIGVITHVEAMQSVLPVGIEVERLPGDSGSRIRQRVRSA